MDYKYYQRSNAIHMRHYVYNYHFHLVWTTKDRNRVFTTSDLVNEMKSILRYIAKKNEITIEQMEIMPDYVHLMLSFKPKLSGTNVVKALKGESTLLLLKKHPSIKKSKFWDGHLWSHDYYISTVGNMSRATVKKYIDNQYLNSHKK